MTTNRTDALGPRTSAEVERDASDALATAAGYLDRQLRLAANVAASLAMRERYA